MVKLLIEELREKYAILDEAIQNSDSNHENSYYALDSIFEYILTININDKNIRLTTDKVDQFIAGMRFIRGEMKEEEAKQYLKSCRTEACKKSLKKLEQNDKD